MIAYISPDWLGHTLDTPDISPGDCILVLIETERQVGSEVRLQELVAVTQMLPLELPAFTSILAVPCPELMVHPEGTFQV